MSCRPAADNTARIGDARSFGILSTFPPTECGIATFSAALAAGVIANGGTVDVVRCGATPPLEDVSVLGTLHGQPVGGLSTPLDVLNGTDVAIIQHEYGIYGGPDGADIIDLLAGITVPRIVVARTVLGSPTANQKWVLEQVCGLSDAIVVMTETARARLTTSFGVASSKVVVIPHGAATPHVGVAGHNARHVDHSPRVLTWGLLGPGKGIEWAIDAFANLADLVRHPHYVIAYCTDDVARLLVVIAREPEPEQAVRELGRTALRFLEDAQEPDGKTRNRCTAAGKWHGVRTVEDCWGRSVWAFGTAAARYPEASIRERALAYFDRAIQQRSRWPRSMAFAALGAAEVLTIDPLHSRARHLLLDAVATVGPPLRCADWMWPEPRLTYANAALAEVHLAAGDLLHRPDMIDDGVSLLRWLLCRETVDGHLSPTPVAGAGPGSAAPGFDQQPIEVDAMADACQRAHQVTGDAEWLTGVDMAARWFDGANDAGATMWDQATGGCYDGLHASGPNLNQGAESTLALVSTLQHARHLSSMAT